jgi:hypothetical protein
MTNLKSQNGKPTQGHTNRVNIYVSLTIMKYMLLCGVIS